MKYTLEIGKKNRFISIVLLNEMINSRHNFPVKLEGDDQILGASFKGMVENGLAEVKDEKYAATEKGRDELVKFYAKYAEYLKIFDIFCAVDLEKGEFAFAKFYDFDNDEDWQKFLDDKRFSDVRIAVAEFKKMDPMEIVFMSFVSGGKFDTDKPGWQRGLMYADAWMKILDICNTAIPLEDLTEDGVIENVINRGSDVMKVLRQREEEDNKKRAEEEKAEAEQGGTTTTVVEETTEEVVEDDDDDYYGPTYVDMPYYAPSYFDPYYDDPYYVSPLWLVMEPVILW